LHLAAERIDLATYLVTADALSARGHQVKADADRARIIRSTLMKPESAQVVDSINATLADLSR